MYAVDLDLILRFVPPMDDHQDGIRLTRTVELPFPPSQDIAIHSKEWEGIDEPLGSHLKEIIWDCDHHRFLAETELSMAGTPIAMIPYEIYQLVENGWQYGSYKDNYQTNRRRGRKRSKLPILDISNWDYNEAESWDTANTKARPHEYKLVLHAVVSTMAELRNNCRVAYAMLKVGGYAVVPEARFGTDLSPLEKNFANALSEYDSLTNDQEWKWAERISRRYPRLIEVVEAIT